jgi:predicted tellurium resistance membrane protein TerC
MTSFQTLSHISNKVPFFKENEKKKIFLEVVGALVLRIISLRKAAEILSSFSYLEDEDIAIEREWKV